MIAHPLDNPVWASLETDHSDFATEGINARRYPADVAPFAGISEDTMPSRDGLAALLSDDPVYLLGEIPTVDDRWIVEQRAAVVQMVCPTLPAPTASSMKFRDLRESDTEAMLELTTLVFPGYFRQRTPLMGRYLGMFADGVLVAMSGERMALRGHREISAVCTRPGFTGRGYAGMLVTTLTRSLLEQGILPFLHVSPDNLRARTLYRTLGFMERAELPLIRIRSA